jgi:hypothetical protein
VLCVREINIINIEVVFGSCCAVLGEFHLCKAVYDNIICEYRNAKHFVKFGFHICNQETMVPRSSMKEVLTENTTFLAYITHGTLISEKEAEYELTKLGV